MAESASKVDSGPTMQASILEDETPRTAALSMHPAKSKSPLTIAREEAAGGVGGCQEVVGLLEGAGAGPGAGWVVG